MDKNEVLLFGALLESDKWQDGYGSWSVVSKEEFKNVLLNSEIENMNTRKIVQLVDSI